MDINKSTEIFRNFTIYKLEKKIKDNPFNIVDDYYVRLALDILYNKALYGTPNESEFSKNILNSIGLKAFVPEKAKKKIPRLRYWKNNPVLLSIVIDRMKEEIKPFWKNKGKNKIDRVKKILDYYDIKYTEKDIRTIRRSEASYTITNITLSIFSFINKLKFETLKQFYYGDMRNLIKSNSTKPKVKPPKNIKWQELIEDHYLSKLADSKSYQIFKSVLEVTAFKIPEK